jgi:hypothetical protein
MVKGGSHIENKRIVGTVIEVGILLESGDQHPQKGQACKKSKEGQASKTRDF